MTKNDTERYEVDPDDQLKREIIGEWSAEKHLRLRRYIEITRSTRKKFENKNPSYVELYCATGRARIRGNSREVVDGSAIVAATALLPPEGFTDIYIGDLDQEHLDACSARLRASGASQRVHTFNGPAVETARIVASRINRYGLHLALLDPYNIESLPFSVIETLGQVKHMDLLVHISENDLQRNIIGKAEYHRLDAFAPGWQASVDVQQPPHIVKRQILDHWRSLLASIGYKVSHNIERVTGGKGQPLYWLVLAARHDIADKFWAAARDIGRQRELL
jgi:three-Cys-motif partner protein